MNRLISAITLLFFFTLVHHSKIMAQNKFSIQVNISKSDEEVWGAITDFPSYQQWNSVLNMSDNDHLEIGKKFKVTITDDKGKQSTFKAKLLTKELNTSFSARQIMLGKWFFSATHHFVLKKVHDSETTFIQTWDFTGVVFKLFRKTILNQMERFNQMNEDLGIYLKK